MYVRLFCRIGSDQPITSTRANATHISQVHRIGCFSKYTMPPSISDQFCPPTPYVYAHNHTHTQTGQKPVGERSNETIRNCNHVICQPFSTDVRFECLFPFACVDDMLDGWLTSNPPAHNIQPPRGGLLIHFRLNPPMPMANRSRTRKRSRSNRLNCRWTQRRTACPPRSYRRSSTPSGR